MRQPVALGHACRLINHGPTVLVSSEHDGRRNVMAAAWSMPVEFTPPRVAVVIDKSAFKRLDADSKILEPKSSMKEAAPADLNQRIAQRVRSLRAARGLSQ